jgi:shikimate kinase
MVVWLAADPAVLAARLSSAPNGIAGRPALTYLGTLEEIGEIIKVRAPLYREAADVVVETDRLSEIEVADAILERIPRSFSQHSS